MKDRYIAEYIAANPVQAADNLPHLLWFIRDYNDRVLEYASKTSKKK